MLKLHSSCLIDHTRQIFHSLYYYSDITCRILSHYANYIVSKKETSQYTYQRCPFPDIVPQSMNLVNVT